MDLDNPNTEGLPYTRPLNPSLRLEAVPYQPDGGFSPFGMLVVFLFVLLGALGLGYGTSWVKQWFYIILLFPFLIGAVLGIFGAIGVYVGNVRNVFLASLAGLFGGGVAMLSMHYFDYERFLARAQQEKMAPAKNGAARVAPVDGGQPTFLEYVDGRARIGIPVQFRRIHFNLGFVGSYIYWLVEILIVSVMALAIMRGCATDPFCSVCSTWKDKRSLGTLTMSPETAVQIFTAGEVVRLADHDFPEGEGQIHCTAWVCKTCGAEAPVDVKLEQVTKNAKNEDDVKELAYVTYPGQALPVLVSLFGPEAGPVQADRSKEEKPL